MIDIAQDLLLAELSKEGVLDNIAIKGGTALRKLYAGKEGRFSLDLDFAITSFNQNLQQVSSDFVAAVDGREIGPFKYGISERRGKWSVIFGSPFVKESSLKTQLDFSAAPWLKPILRGWVDMPVHELYDEKLPNILTIRLEKNIAEKIARLNRTSTARDMYDLAWIMENPNISCTISKKLIRRISVLKIWVDTNGLRGPEASWAPGHKGSIFDPECWLRTRKSSEFDIQDIGALSVPAPSLENLSKIVCDCYRFLSDLDDDERVVARSDERDRSLVIRMIKGLPDSQLNEQKLY